MSLGTTFTSRRHERRTQIEIKLFQKLCDTEMMRDSLKKQHDSLKPQAKTESQFKKNLF